MGFLALIRSNLLVCLVFGLLVIWLIENGVRELHAEDPMQLVQPQITFRKAAQDVMTEQVIIKLMQPAKTSPRKGRSALKRALQGIAFVVVFLNPMALPINFAMASLSRNDNVAYAWYIVYLFDTTRDDMQSIALWNVVFSAQPFTCFDHDVECCVWAFHVLVLLVYKTSDDQFRSQLRKLLLGGYFFMQVTAWIAKEYTSIVTLVYVASWFVAVVSRPRDLSPSRLYLPVVLMAGVVHPHPTALAGRTANFLPMHNQTLQVFFENTDTAHRTERYAMFVDCVLRLCVSSSATFTAEDYRCTWACVFMVAVLCLKYANKIPKTTLFVLFMVCVYNTTSEETTRSVIGALASDKMVVVFAKTDTWCNRTDSKVVFEGAWDKGIAIFLTRVSRLFWFSGGSSPKP